MDETNWYDNSEMNIAAVSKKHTFTGSKAVDSILKIQLKSRL
jgi:hypothetical protein